LKKQLLVIVLCLAAILNMLSGCAVKAKATDLLANIKPREINLAGITRQDQETVAEFALQLFEKCADENNALISPLSVLGCLALAANGAQGETLEQMEELFGIKLNTLNGFLAAYVRDLPSEKKSKVEFANSVWYKDGFEIKQEYLQTLVDYYDAQVYQEQFDSRTVNKINSWVSDHTDGMIKDIIDGLNPLDRMVLVNALYFDGEWENVYKEPSVRDALFTTEQGQEIDVKMMSSGERLYLSDENASGFIKYYKDRNYAFAALLPNEGMSVSEYILTLSGEKLVNMLANPEEIEVRAQMPKFEFEDSMQLNEVLKTLGMKDAFVPSRADFGKVADGPLYISSVIHKTFIEVAEKDTRAGAATAVTATGAAAPREPRDYREVVLDRPFVFMIIDCEYNLPIFIGSVMEP